MLTLIWCMMGLIALGKGMALTTVQEVSLGDMAVLKCPSNDEEHRFQYWELSSKDIIGPGNNIDQRKYKYEVLTGTLYIKSISSHERGIYTCISKHLDSPTMSAKSIELVVKQDWESVYENDSSTNFLRILVVMLSIILIAILGFIAFTLKRDRSSQFRDFLDEESGGTPTRDDIAGISGSYKSTVTPIQHGTPSKSIFVNNNGIDNPAMSYDTDFPKEFTSVTIENQSRM